MQYRASTAVPGSLPGPKPDVPGSEEHLPSEAADAAADAHVGTAAGRADVGAARACAR